MKKLIIYILCVVFLCFLIPILFTKNLKTNSTQSEIVQDSNNETTYDYGKYNKVKLLHTDTEKIEEIDLDTYLYGVVSSEMPANFEMEALKAQAVVARTYTLYKIINNNSKHGDADICDDSTCCQAWISKEDRFKRWKEEERESNWEKIVNAVNGTKGKIITYEGKPINAFFHSNSGGTTDTATNVWGGSNYPYLQAVTTSGEDAYSQYSSEVSVTKDEFISKIKEKHSDFEIDFSKEKQIEILEYTDGGRIKTIKIGNLNLSGVEIRTIFGLRSARFEIKTDGDNIKFTVLGYGHGVGMSQTGADSMAKQGANYEEIIKHFYTGVEITNI